jgi:hypothetical protein
MTKQARIAIIKSIGEARGTHVITYITSTRPGLETPMAMDSIRFIYEHLRKITKTKEDAKIDLFLHSNGGDGIVPWKLVTLIREYCSEFNVIVPHCAFSAATLVALGANSIVMHPMGMLGPTDPTVTNHFNPQDPQNPQQLLGISVEDVTAYFTLVKDDVGIRHEDELIQAFKILAEKVHPLALGNVKRFQSQSRMLAKKLMYLHHCKEDAHNIDEIANNLTSKLFFHGHPINRQEAKELGLNNVIIPDKPLEDLIWNLYREYEKEMSLNDPFNPIQEFIKANPTIQPNQSVTMKLNSQKSVYIESEHHTNVNIIDSEVTGTKLPNGLVQGQVGLLKQKWEEE